LKDLGRNERILDFKTNLKETVWEGGSGLNCLRTELNGAVANTVIKIWVYKRREISIPVKLPLAFQQGLCLMELVFD
jgi:hypothetical protein